MKSTSKNSKKAEKSQETIQQSKIKYNKEFRDRLLYMLPLEFSGSDGVTWGSCRSLANEWGVSPQTAGRIVKGHIPSKKILEKVAKHLNCSAHWLVTGVNDAEASESASLHSQVRIPFLNYQGNDALMPYAALADLGVSSENLKFVQIKGDSMEPDLYSGDLVLIDCSATTLQYLPKRGVFVVRIKQDVFAKRCRFTKDVATLISTNPLYEDITIAIDDEDFEVLGKVVWSGGKFRF